MKIIVDEVFGRLKPFADTFDHILQNAEPLKFKLSLFGKSTDNFEMTIYCDDDDGTILEEQRKSFLVLQENQIEIMARLEEAVFQYCIDYCSEMNLPVIRDKKELSDKIELTGLVFPMVSNKGDISFGFLFETEIDDENGIGVIFTNGELEVGYQDLLT